MHNLETFLIDKGYCHTIKEASKILESISGEFYEYLVEEVSASKRLGSMRSRMDNLISSLMKDPTNTEIQRKIKTIRSELPRQERISRAERTVKQIQGDNGIAATPKGPDGSRAQTSDIATTKTASRRKDGKQRTGAAINDPRISSAAEREASRLTGTTSEVERAGGASRQFTGTRRTGKYFNMQSGGRATSALPNRGISSSGAQFPR